MYELLKKLTYDDLNEEDKQLADCIGLESFKKFIDAYGGLNFNVKKPETICIEIRNRQIKQEFDGGNYKKLALKYGISEIHIRRIINSK